MVVGDTAIVVVLAVVLVDVGFDTTAKERIAFVGVVVVVVVVIAGVVAVVLAWVDRLVAVEEW